MQLTQRYKWTIRMAVITPLLIIICILFMGGGNGTYVPGMLFFPIATSNLILQDVLIPSLLFLSLFQFTIYGFIVDKSHNKPRVTILLFVFHLVWALAIIYLRRPEWI